MSNSGDHDVPVYLLASDCDLDDEGACEGESGDMSQIDLPTVDLCKVHNKKTKFCKAIEKGQLGLLEKLLAHIKSNPIKYPCGKIIYLIAGCGSEEIKNMKLSLLSRAVVKNDLDIVEVLFETLRDYDLAACAQVFFLRFGPGKYTIIHQAVELPNLEIVDYLINTFIKTKTAQGLTYAAVWNSLREVLNIRDRINATPLDLAFERYACAGHSDSLKILSHLVQYVDPWCYIESKHSLMLHVVAQCGDKATLESMINVVREGSKRIPNRQDKDMAYKIVNLLDKDRRTLLYRAVQGGDYDTVEYLMELGADCTFPDETNTSPLFIAIGLCDLDMVELLLDKAFPGNESLALNINKQGKGGLTPLHVAVLCRDRTIISAALQCVSRREKYNNDAESRRWVGKHDPQIVQALLKAGADPSIPDNAGNTPLHKAVAKIRVPLVNLLLDAGADPLAKNLKGCHALDVAVKQILVRPSAEYDPEYVMGMFFKLVKKIMKPNHVVDLQQCQDAFLFLNRDVLAVYRHGNHGCQRAKFENLLVPILEDCGISANIISQNKHKKRPCDADPSPIQLNKRYKRKITQQCDGSSSGRSHAT